MKSLKRLLVTILTAAMVVNTIPATGIESFAAQNESEEKISITSEEKEQLTDEADKKEVSDSADEEAVSEEISEENEDSENTEAVDSQKKDIVIDDDTDPEEAGSIEDEKLDVKDTTTVYGVCVGDQWFKSNQLRITCGGGTATYDPDTETLTLYNIVSETGYHTVTSYDTADAELIGKKTAILVNSETGNITIKGSANFKNADIGLLALTPVTIDSGSNVITLIAEKNAVLAETLTVNSGDFKCVSTSTGYDSAILIEDTLDINAGKVYAGTSAESGAGIEASTITVDGGSVSVDSDGNSGVGIKVSSKLEVNGGELEVKNYEEDYERGAGAIVATSGAKVIINGGTVVASSDSDAIFANGGITISNDMGIEKPAGGYLGSDSRKIMTNDNRPANAVKLSKRAIVTFSLNGKTGSGPVEQAITIGGKVGEPTYVPISDGYLFDGWYKEASCINKWDFDSDTVTGDTVLYAKWKTVISNITATSSDIDSIPGNGADTNNPTFTVTGGAPAYFVATNGWWEKKNGSTWEGDYDGKFDAGTYRYKVQIMIDGSSAADHVLKESGVSVKVNGKTWTQDGSVTVLADMSHVFVVSPEYTVSSTPSIYDIWVGSTQVTAANKDNIPVTGGGKAVFNPSTNTLTFSGTVTGVNGQYNDSLIYSDLDSLTISGDASLSNDKWTYCISAKELVIDNANLTITSEKPATSSYNINTESLTVKSGKLNAVNKKYGNAIYTEDLIVNGGEIKAQTADNSSAVWIYTGKFEITGGKIFAQSDKYFAIYAYGDHCTVNIKGGTVEGKAVKYSTVLYSDNVINISGGTFKASPIDKEDGYPYGIKAVRQLSVTGGLVDSEGYIKANPINLGSGISVKYPLGAKLSDDKTNVVDKNGDEIKDRIMIASSSYCAVSYDLNGKPGDAPEGVVVASGSKLTKPADPTVEGYVFGGWYKDAACTNAWNFSTDTVTSDRILYAKLTPISYTVTYDKNKPTEATYSVSGTTANSSHTYGVEKELTANGYSLKKYKFIGWNTKADGTGTSYSDKQSVKNLTNVNGASITLYAQWEKAPVENYKLYIGSTQVTSDNMEDIPGVLGGGKASYDPDTNTLTFTGNVTGVTGTHDNAQICCYGDKLVIKGNATLKNDSARYGIYAAKDLIIDGAKLDVNAGYHAVYIFYSDGTLTVKNNADLKAISTATGYAGMHVGNFVLESGKVYTEGDRYSIQCDKKIIINGGELRAISSVTGSNSDSGIYVNDFEINGGKVYCESKNYVALYITNNADFNGGSVEAVSYGSKYRSVSEAIYCGGDINIKNGTLKLTGPVYAIKSDKKLTISGGSVEADGTIMAKPISIGTGMSIKTPVGAKIDDAETTIVDKDGNTVTENILIAGENICVVSFDLNGTEGTAPETQLITKGNKAVKPADPVPPANKLFKGWYKEKECKNLYNFDTVVNSNLVLYAGYKDDMTGAVDLTTAFTDEAFRKYISEEFDKDKDGKLSKYEISNVTEINLIENLGIKSIKGVEKLTGLKILRCAYNELTSVDLNSNTNLEEIDLSGNKLTSINTAKLTNLKILSVGGNNISSINLSNNKALTKLEANENNLTGIKLGNNTDLTFLNLENNNLTAIDLSENTKLQRAYFTSNKLSEINLSKNTDLIDLMVTGNQLSKFDVSANTKLAFLRLSNNKINTLNLSTNKGLRTLVANNCGLKALDLSANTKLQELWVKDNELSSLDLSKNTSLEYLSAENNKLPYVNLVNCPKITADNVKVDNNVYELGDVGESFKVTSIPGFDTSRATNWKGAAFDTDTKTLFGFTADTVTFDYLCRDGVIKQFAFNLILKGAETFEVTFEGRGMEKAVYRIVKNGKVTSRPTSPTYTGYEFVGWYITDKKGVESPFDFNTPITENITIHAKQVPISYTVKFDPNGASGTMADVIRQYDDRKGLPVCTFNFGGKSFKEWNTEKDGSGFSYAEKYTGNLTDKKGGVITLYAQWDNWGEVPADVRNDLFGSDLNQANAYIKGGVWYAFYNGTKWCKESEARIVKTYTGDAITFNKDIMVFHGFRRLWENRDYTVSYANNKLIVNGKAPSFTIKGKGSYNNSKTLGFEIEAADITDAFVTSEAMVTVALKSKLGSVKPAVTFNGKKLSAGKDYDIVYFDGDTTDDSKRMANAAAFVITDANKTYTVAVKGKGNFKGLLKAANVKAVDTKAANTVQASKLKLTDKNGKAVSVIKTAYTGNEIDYKKLFETTYKVSDASKRDLVYGSDYTVEVAEGTVKYAGKYTLRIVGKMTANANGITYVGSKSVPFEVTGTDISKVKIAGLLTSVEYMGRPIELRDLFNKKDKNLSNGWDTVTLYTIDPKSKAKTALTEGKDYVVSMENNGAVGKFDIVFTGINGCYGTLKKSVKITAYNVNDSKKDVLLRKINVSVDGSAVYSKDGAVPKVTVTFEGKILREGIDYTLAYKNNKKTVADFKSLKAGARPTVTVKGAGNFVGSNATAYFNIEKRVISESNISVEIPDVVYNAKGKTGYFLPKPNQIKLMDGTKPLTVGKGKDIEALNSADYRFTYADAVTLADGTKKAAGSEVNASDKLPADKTTVIKVTIGVLSSNASPYSTGGGKKDIAGTYKVIAASKTVKSAKIALKKGVQTSFNNGEAIGITAANLTVSVKQGKAMVNLKADVDYEVVSVKNNRFLGTATVTIKGKGQYGGTKTFTFKVGARTIFG